MKRKLSLVALLFLTIFLSLTASAYEACKAHNFPKDCDVIVGKLMALEILTILDRGAGEAACKAIGQSAFDLFKEKQLSESNDAFADLQNIVDIVGKLARFEQGEARSRKGYIERAFAGVGDSVVTWWP